VLERNADVALFIGGSDALVEDSVVAGSAAR
jgi:hypothetical protein